MTETTEETGRKVEGEIMCQTLGGGIRKHWWLRDATTKVATSPKFGTRKELIGWLEENQYQSKQKLDEAMKGIA